MKWSKIALLNEEKRPAKTSAHFATHKKLVILIRNFDIRILVELIQNTNNGL